MDDLEQIIEQRANALIETQSNNSLEMTPENDGVYGLIRDKVKATDNVKEAIDLLATESALSEQKNVAKIVEEKSEELRADAVAKRIKAETELIAEEVSKVKAQAEKELAEIEKEIKSKRLEVEQLKAESDKEDAFFERNKEILKYVNIKTKKTLKVMQGLMIPAVIIFFCVQVLIFPVTICGLLLENIFGIVGSVCGAIANKAWKIIIAVIVVIITIAIFVLVYYYGIKFIKVH